MLSAIRITFSMHAFHYFYYYFFYYTCNMKKRKNKTHEHLTAQQFMATFFVCYQSKIQMISVELAGGSEIMTHSFVLLGCKVDLSIPQ